MLFVRVESSWWVVMDSPPPFSFQPLFVSTCQTWLTVYLSIARHKAILDYLSASGFTESFNSLKSETHNEDFTSDPKQKYSGLLEKKWTSVIRLQKKVRPLLYALEARVSYIPK